MSRVRVTLRFRKEIVNLPITSEIIRKQKTQINILAAHVNQEGGEILAEIETTKAQEVIEDYRKYGVTVDVRNLVEVDKQKCVDCGSCYSICPVDAISIKPDYSIEFDEKKCVGISCGLCVDTCPTRAIRLIG